ncbi:class IV adenylate cyclase [Haloimpatiens sp. FM7315]|uniref:class IV adenylate cyclase n=1 Tax=Haloimpatiens sp. FM7315 TaxID=3298609 RepID=UPI0035A32253
MKELEIRIVDIDVEILRNNLINLGCLRVKEENQINHIYDFKDHKLIKSKGYARIRVVEDLLRHQTVNYMTLKKLVSQDKYKIMDEQEIKIDNSDIGRKIFEGLGLIVVESIKKYRESYKYKSTLIEIDINDKSFCPFPYIEIEGSNEKEVHEIVNLLGYSMDDTTSKTIYEILKDKGIKKEL